MEINNGFDLVIYGCSSFTESIISLCNKLDKVNVVAICVDDDYLHDLPKKIKKIDVIGFNDALHKFNKAKFVIAIGYKKMRSRKIAYNKLKEHNLALATLISPHSYVSTNIIGDGCIIFDGVVVENDAVLKNNVVVWSNSTICHDVEIGDHCFIAANTTMGGFSKIGELSFVGFSVTIINSINIGSECLIGASSLVNKDIKEYSKCYGVPAKIVNNISQQVGIIII